MPIRSHQALARIPPSKRKLFAWSEAYQCSGCPDFSCIQELVWHALLRIVFSELSPGGQPNLSLHRWLINHRLLRRKPRACECGGQFLDDSGKRRAQCLDCGRRHEYRKGTAFADPEPLDEIWEMVVMFCECPAIAPDLKRYHKLSEIFLQSESCTQRKLTPCLTWTEVAKFKRERPGLPGERAVTLGILEQFLRRFRV